MTDFINSISGKLNLFFKTLKFEQYLTFMRKQGLKIKMSEYLFSKKIKNIM